MFLVLIAMAPSSITHCILLYIDRSKEVNVAMEVADEKQTVHLNLSVERNWETSA